MFILIMSLAFCFYAVVIFFSISKEINNQRLHNNYLINVNELLVTENLKLKSKLKKWKRCRAENGQFFKCED